MKILFNEFHRIDSFDKITNFRLVNAVFSAFNIGLLAPIFISLKGLYFAAWLISAFSIVQVLSVKTNDYMIKKFDISTIYKFGVIVHILYVFGFLLYYYSPELMVWVDSTVAIIEVAVFSAFSIALNNYITGYYPNSYSDFQIVRNSIWADGNLTGLAFTAIASYFLGLNFTLGIIIIINIGFSYWLLINWNLIDNELKRLKRGNYEDSNVG